MKNLTLIILLLFTMSSLTQARSRRGRSFGRRGSRSMFKNTKRTNNLRTRPQKVNSKNYNNQRSNPLSNLRSNGGFMKSMMGAVAGTMVGGFLFRAFGGNSGNYQSGAASGNSGGTGLFFPLLLIAAGAFFYFKYKKQKSNNTPHDLVPPVVDTRYNLIQDDNDDEEEIDELDYTNNPAFMKDRNKDFFVIQHAWSQKKLDKVKDKIGQDVFNEFTNEINEMKQKGHTSTLENLMINSSACVASWNEEDNKYVTLKFDVSLIEYECDQKGIVISGSKENPTDISEFWTFSKQGSGHNWLVSAIENP